MKAYYNENEPYAAQWLRNLIEAGHIAPGIVDERSIEDVTPSDLRGFTQHHFFAGVGVWSHALRMAGWADNRPVWTGSCPCQPFSQAGKGAGVDDERHLWPHFHWLIQQCRPDVVFGEQVSSKDGLAWIDVVQTDLEGAGYTSGAIDTCSAGVGAPHIRQRLYWMAHANCQRAGAGLPAGEWGKPAHSRTVGGLANTFGKGRIRNGRQLERSDNERHWPETSIGQQRIEQSQGLLHASGLERPSGDGRQGWLFGWQDPQRQIIDRPIGCDGTAYATLPVNGFWRDADWLFCRDGKWRAVEPSTFPLVARFAKGMGHGKSSLRAVAGRNRVGRLKGYGNAINAEAAKHFIKAFMEVENDATS